ncbi:MAG: trehalose-6-phosphate synthase, partial [Ferroplasma sp.]
LFHYFRGNMKFTRTGFKYYYAANEKFALKIKENIGNDTVIWIHDYQLMMIPEILRSLNVKNTIIFTWHIPWVSPEFFNIVPEAYTLLKSMLESDFITFHTELYENNFHRTVAYMNMQKLMHAKTSAIPLGIDPNRYACKKKHKKSDRIKIIFSIDRMDYTKGLLQRVQAIENLLYMRRDLQGKFVYIMHVTPSRSGIPEYNDIKNSLEMAIGRINGLYSTPHWVPIIYMYRKISEKALLSQYRKSDIALITPLIDGLNLVAMEFVAATDHGVLILSKFAGAAEELRGAILVNPNNVDELTSAIINAFELTEDEIQIRLKRMKSIVYKRNSEWWYRKILNNGTVKSNI